MNNDQLNSATDGNTPSINPKTGTNLFIREYLNGPDGYGWLGNQRSMQNFEIAPPIFNAACGCDEVKALQSLANSQTEMANNYYQNMYLNYPTIKQDINMAPCIK
jgi:hypothetical protein